MDDSSYIRGTSYNDDMLGTRVAWFPYMKSSDPTDRCLKEILDEIQSDKWRRPIHSLRADRIEFGEEVYKQKKEKLPSFFVSGRASSPTKMLTHSGMIQVDLDALNEKLPSIRDQVGNDLHAVSVFTSPSGKGLKILFRIEPLDAPLDKAEHKRAFAAVTAYFREAYGVTPDQSCGNMNRHCLISWDPELVRNPDALAFPWKDQAPGRGAPGGEGSSSNTQLLQNFDTAELPIYHTTPQACDEGMVTSTSKALEAFRFQREIEENHQGLWKQYLHFVERRHEARGGYRNETIVKAIPYLYRALSTSVVRLYMEWFYRTNAHVFKDPLEKHMRQVDEMIVGVELSYAEELGPQEQQFWNELGERGLDTFRITRDLALYSAPNAPAPPLFYLSGESLASRLGLFGKDGRPQGEIGARELRKLIQFGIIEVETPGQRRMANKRGVSTCYSWLLPTQ